MKRIFMLSFFTISYFVSQAQITYLKAVLQGSQEVPPNASVAGGVVIVKYTTTTRILELTGDYQNLSAIITASHIHSPAPVGSNAPVLIHLQHTGGTTGTLKGRDTLTATEEIDLLAGNMYVNVHNINFTAGEIRGQLTTTTAGQTDIFTGRIQGAQQVPPNGSTATGSVTTLLDKTTGMVYLTGSFSGLTTVAGASHIHRGGANANGAVFIDLSFSPATSGTIHVASAISSTDQALMSGGNTYVNIHNATYPGGEIRGQLIMQSQLVYLKASLQGSQEVPPNLSTASGTTIVKYNTVTKFLELNGDYQNLTTPAAAAHIHSPAPIGSNASVLITLTHTGGTSGALSGTATLTGPQELDLLGGLMYVNVHNATFGGGEIRGQLSTTSSGSETHYLTGLLSGSQEVPANSATASGRVTVLLDKITNEVYLTGQFHGLSSKAAMAHIHRGAAGTNGPVVVGLSPTADTTGTINGNAVVRSSFADSIILGFTYVNIHDSVYPGGEIRAQLGNLVLPVKLKYFNGYKQNSKIALVWETTQEPNLKQYEIEQQGQQPGAWINKAVVPAQKGNTTIKYNFLDDPLINTNSYVIYRLKMIDVDGKFYYSPLIRINFKISQPELSIITNPVVNGELKYSITGLQTDKKADIFVIDFNGKVVLKTTAPSLTGNSINISKLPAGTYKFMIRIDEEMLQKSFMK